MMECEQQIRTLDKQTESDLRKAATEDQGPNSVMAVSPAVLA